MKQINYPCVLTIAGTDPSGGAGIQADIKTISATGCYAASVITALVAQNTQGVQAIQEVPAAFVMQQINSVFSDLDISAVKIGMLHNKKIIETVSSALEKLKPKNIVLDPVMVAKNGCKLLPSNIIHFIRERLFPLVNLITPNLFEAEKILGEKIETLPEMESAAEKIGNTFNVNVLLKGGHLNTTQSSDVLYSKKDLTHYWFHEERINTKNTHGTGCTLSSAIASYLAQGCTLQHAIHISKKYLTKAIESGRNFQIGRGCGPVNHFYLLTGDEKFG
ncbi:MAG TPA: bifunctional hydroxymethylpyrimidine kinase/phosphomethylpyrimidine kinase [Gammaproteobacteria bacterium]|jgi:hydroxymethylpyrimidine/phosphomethylpyrimidine kinase|nr:bifunctional hydroxymethylpyrimidine kinase/phosphomethylpyrimidine kinase [Gammaproteobacteria bacterium]